MTTIDKIIDEELSDGMLSKLEDFEIQYIKDCMIKFAKVVLDKAGENANLIGKDAHNENRPNDFSDSVYVVDQNGPDYIYTVNKESITETINEFL
jgi:hypothetical protein